jgi:hypothetical protein
VPFLRVTRDQRGYENTFLLHTAHPGERPRVLYWYRSAPGVRVGRPPLDEDAIRAIEERHPEIEFDWAHILEVGAMTTPEVERRPERPKRKAPRPRSDEAPPAPADAMERSEPDAEVTPAPIAEVAAEPTIAAPPRSGLLEELVGREIAVRLRARHAEIEARIRAAGSTARADWRARANALNPDNWTSPDQVLRGVEAADALFDKLRRELADAGAEPGV